MKIPAALPKLLKHLFKPSSKVAEAALPAATGLPVPAHVAIIMDGNNRWAQQRNLAGASGHRSGVETIRKVLSACQQRGINVLTLYAFSSENWLRPEPEVQGLMKLLKLYLRNEVEELHSRGTRVRFIGRRDRLDADIIGLMQRAEQMTAANNEGQLVLAIDYGGRWDIATAAHDIAAKVLAGEIELSAIDEAMVSQHVSLADLPVPDLCIRTGAEHRLSNFLLWQLSYAELYFCDCLWPDFDEQQFYKALHEFGVRQRRFGKAGSQVGQQIEPLANSLAVERVERVERVEHKVAGWPPHA